MTEYSYPFGSSKISTEDEFSRMMRWAAPDGVCGSPADNALRPVANGTGMITVPPGEAFVRGQKYLLDAEKQIPIPTNSTGGLRRDYIVLRNDPSNDRITAEYKQGGASLPTLTQDWNSVWEVPLGVGAVEAGTSIMQPAAMQDARWFVGWPLAPSVPGSRPAPHQGRALVENGSILLGNGTAWTTVIGDTGWIDLTIDWDTVWQTAGLLRARLRNGWVDVDIEVTRIKDALGVTDPDGSRICTLPAELRTSSFRYFSCQFAGAGSAGGISARLQLKPDGSIWCGGASTSVPPGRHLRQTINFIP